MDLLQALEGTIVAPPLVSWGAIADPTLYHQSQLFQTAKAAKGGDWIRADAWDLGTGDKHPKTDTAVPFPDSWPMAHHDILSFQLFSNLLNYVC